MNTAKVFWPGRSHAIRLPKVRFETSEVRIRRHGDMVILEPLASGWAWIDVVVGPLDADFVAALEERFSDQSRPELDVVE